MKIGKKTKIVMVLIDIIALLYAIYYLYFAIEGKGYLYLFIACIQLMLIVTIALCIISKKIRKIIGIILEMIWHI